MARRRWDVDGRLPEPPADRGRTLEILTGSDRGDRPFAAHGHILRLIVPPTSSSGE